MSAAGGDTARLLRALVESAVLAPSSHNTQPWTFRIDGDRLELRADRTRALPVNDPDDRELTISCGAAWLNLRVAAQHHGVAPAPAPGAPGVLAAATVGTGPPEAGLPPLETVARRRTHRGAFVDRKVPAETLEELRAAAAAEGAALTVLGADEREPVASLVAEGDRRQFADPRWRRELAAWMHPRRNGDGLPVRAPIAPLIRFVLAHVDVGRRVAARDAALARRAPVLAVVTTEADRETDRLAAGQALERVLLVACQAGLQASYLNQPIQVEPLRGRVRALLGDGGIPQLLLRLGQPAGTHEPAPRRPLAAVLEAPPAT